jgi:hypothetical protein
MVGILGAYCYKGACFEDTMKTLWITSVLLACFLLSQSPLIALPLQVDQEFNALEVHDLLNPAPRPILQDAMAQQPRVVKLIFRITLDTLIAPFYVLNTCIPFGLGIR